MKVIKCSFLALCLPLFLMAGNDGETIEKKISKEFNIETNGRVELHNKYGSMDIGIGEANKVKIEIMISVTAGSEKKAQEGMENIDINFEEGMNRVRATTEIATSSGWMSWINTGKMVMDIHYQVFVPADVYLELSNKYGDIYVETTNKDISIDIAYGAMRLGDINAKLDLEMSYSDGSMSKIGDGNLNLSFSDLEMEDGKDIVLDMKYTDLKAGNLEEFQLVSSFSDIHVMSIGQMEYTGKYDDVVVEQATSLTAKSGFSGIEVQALSGDGNFDMRYGELKVEDIQRSIKRLDITTSYTGVALEFDPNASLTIDAETNYCDIEHDGLKVSENIDKSTSRIFKATKGSGTSPVVIRMNYGELVIK